MRLDTQIIPANTFLRTTATGELDFPKTKAILQQAVGKAEHSSLEILLDFRHASSCGPLSPSQLWRLVQTFEQHPSLRGRKIALLLNGSAPGTKAAIFELCANSRGFQVQAFKDFEKALYWLANLKGNSAPDAGETAEESS